MDNKEIISLKSLKKVYSLTDKKFDHEHITNFMYQNCDKFFKVTKTISASPLGFDVK